MPSLHFDTLHIIPLDSIHALANQNKTYRVKHNPQSIFSANSSHCSCLLVKVGFLRDRKENRILEYSPPVLRSNETTVLCERRGTIST
jgi:hypothetical protein